MIELKRWYHEDCTIGRLKIEGFQCFTLELPWLNNHKNISCIHTGVYGYFFRNSSRNGSVLELLNVHGRTNIQIHSGNYISQIRGCILTGDSVKWLNSDKIPDVTNSRNTLRRILALAGRSGHIFIN